MRKFAAVCIGIGLMFTVTGCGNDIKLSTEENNIVAEYIAGVMLKHSYEYQWEYQKLDILKNKTAAEESTKSSTTTNNTTTPTQSAVSSNTTPTSAPTTIAKEIETEPSSVSDSTILMTAMKKALGLEAADVSYTAMLSGIQYPEGEYVVSVPANKSCVVVAVEFQIRNNTAANIVANTASSDVTMKLRLEGTTFAKSYTILKNDITRLNNVTIEPGQTYTACAVFQIPEAFAESLDTAALTVYSQDNALGTMNLK